MFLLVLAHPGFTGQNPQSRKTVVCEVLKVWFTDTRVRGCYGDRTRSRAGESSRRRVTSASKSRHCQTDDVTTEDAAAMLIPNHAVRNVYASPRSA